MDKKALIKSITANLLIVIFSFLILFGIAFFPKTLMESAILILLSLNIYFGYRYFK